jgi:hypothetical protein
MEKYQMTDMTEAAKVLLDSYLPYFVIEFPVNAEGNGPASSDDVDKVLYEIWDAETIECLQSHEQLSSAILGWLKLLSEYTQDTKLKDYK